MAKNYVKAEGALTTDTRKIINDNIRDISRCTSQFSLSSSTTLGDVTGLLTDTLQPGTYKVNINLITTAGAAGGVKAALKFGTASMLTSVQLSVKAFSAAAVAATTFTTATDAASMVAGTAAYVNVQIEGTIVVAIAGTLQLQAAQNASNGTATTVEVGSTMEFTPIGATTSTSGAVA